MDRCGGTWRPGRRHERGRRGPSRRSKLSETLSQESSFGQSLTVCGVSLDAEVTVERLPFSLIILPKHLTGPQASPWPRILSRDRASSSARRSSSPSAPERRPEAGGDPRGTWCRRFHRASTKTADWPTKTEQPSNAREESSFSMSCCSSHSVCDADRTWSSRFEIAKIYVAPWIRAAPLSLTMGSWNCFAFQNHRCARVLELSATPSRDYWMVHVGMENLERSRAVGVIFDSKRWGFGTLGCLSARSPSEFWEFRAIQYIC